MRFHAGPAPEVEGLLYSTRIPSKLSWMRPLVINLGSKLVEEGLVAEEERNQFEICFSEALSNAISHGNQSDPQLQVYVRLYGNEDEWGVIVDDEGEGFEADQVPDPKDPEFPLKERGRGIFLMRHMMDTVEYYDGGRTLLLSKKRVASGNDSSAEPVQAGPLHIAKTKKAVIARIALSSMEDPLVDAVFEQIRKALLEAGPTVVVVDFSRTNCLSSNALGRLVTLRVTSLRLGHELRLSGVGKALLGIFASTGLETVFSFFPTTKEALGPLAPAMQLASPTGTR